MSLPVVIPFFGSPGRNKKKCSFNFTFLVLSSQTVNVSFWHEDGGGEPFKYLLETNQSWQLRNSKTLYHLLHI